MMKCTMMDRTEFNFRIEVLSVLLKNVATNSNNGALYESADEWITRGNLNTEGLIDFFKLYYH